MYIKTKKLYVVISNETIYGCMYVCRYYVFECICIEENLEAKQTKKPKKTKKKTEKEEKNFAFFAVRSYFTLFFFCLLFFLAVNIILKIDF